MPELSSHGSVTNMRYVFQRNSGAPRRPKGCAEGHKLKPGNTAAVAGTNATASSINSARGSAREEIPADSCGMRRRFLAKSDLIATEWNTSTPGVVLRDTLPHASSQQSASACQGIRLCSPAPRAKVSGASAPFEFGLIALRGVKRDVAFKRRVAVAVGAPTYIRRPSFAPSAVRYAHNKRLTLAEEKALLTRFARAAGAPARC